MSDADAKPAVDMTGFARAEYDINGVKTVVHSIGSGPEFVFLHGTGTFTGFEFARALSARRKVVIPYNPNFGDSGDDPSLDTIEDYVLHYMDLFDRLGLTKFDLGGFSLGGWLAAEFAIRQPERLRRRRAGCSRGPRCRESARTRAIRDYAAGAAVLSGQ